MNTPKTSQTKSRLKTYRLSSFLLHNITKKNRKSKERATFLNSICSDAGVCIAFGKENETIKIHFKGFTYLKYVNEIIETIFADNGFLNVFMYENKGYKSNAILKSSTDERADNLFFEYLVGQYVNKLNVMYPCFLETYGMFRYKDETSWELYKNARNWKKFETPEKHLLLQKEINDNSFKESCLSSKYLCVLIQHINEAKTLYECLNDIDFIKNDLLFILYQIYMPLAMVANTFTHYDLHDENVLLYEPIKGKYIEYYYHIDNKIIKFKSAYIAKIIDYGRCFFEDDTNDNNDTNSSANIYIKICNIHECFGEEVEEDDTNDNNIYNCGIKYGYINLAPENPPGYFNYKSCSIRNMSNDLELLYDLLYEIKISKNLHPELLELLSKVIYKKELKNKIGKGTIECTPDSSNYLDGKINNVIDAHSELMNLVISKNMQKLNKQFYSTKEKIGNMHVYNDGRPMEFEEA